MPRLEKGNKFITKSYWLQLEMKNWSVKRQVIYSLTYCKHHSSRVLNLTKSKRISKSTIHKTQGKFICIAVGISIKDSFRVY